MKKGLLGLFGAGGFAREAMPLAAFMAGVETTAPFDECVFVEIKAGPPSNGVKVIGETDFFAAPKKIFFNVAVADSELRRKLADMACSRGAVPMSLIAPNAIIYEGNEIGEGAIICANSIITSNAKIGRFFQMNIYSYVAHDCEIGDFVTFGPRVSCNGNIVIEDGAYIGTGAILRQGLPGRPLRIGADAVVGMGAVVTKNVPTGATVIGNPARPIERN